MRFLFKLALFAGVLVGAAWLYGRAQPRAHVEGSSVVMVAPPDSVYALLRNFGRAPSWWSDVRSSRRLTGRRRESWEQDLLSAGVVQFEVTSEIPGQRLVTTILNDEQQDFGGTWTYTVRSTAEGTEVRIVESGWVDAPLFRVMNKLRGGPRKTIDSMLKSLAAQFGETVTPRRVTTR
jgi:uncharacterized protein YndB with AHSA1/START domain